MTPRSTMLCKATPPPYTGGSTRKKNHRNLRGPGEHVFVEFAMCCWTCMYGGRWRSKTLHPHSTIATKLHFMRMS